MREVSCSDRNDFIWIVKAVRQHERHEYMCLFVLCWSKTVLKQSAHATSVHLHNNYVYVILEFLRVSHSNIKRMLTRIVLDSS